MRKIIAKIKEALKDPENKPLTHSEIVERFYR